MADEMIFCPFCGKRLAANASFCVYCGKQIPVSHSQSMNRKSSEESKSNGNRKLATIILAIIALLFVGLGVKFALGGSNSGSKTPIIQVLQQRTLLLPQLLIQVGKQSLLATWLVYNIRRQWKCKMINIEAFWAQKHLGIMK